jgi:hypothetical protein
VDDEVQVSIESGLVYARVKFYKDELTEMADALERRGSEVEELIDDNPDLEESLKHKSRRYYELVTKLRHAALLAERRLLNELGDIHDAG